MSSTSVQIFEADRPWAEGMKRFRANVVPGLKAAQKAKMLRSWPLVQTGDHTGMLIFGYPNKSARTNFRTRWPRCAKERPRPEPNSGFITARLKPAANQLRSGK